MSEHELPDKDNLIQEQAETIEFLKREITSLYKRIEHLEDRLGLPVKYDPDKTDIHSIDKRTLDEFIKRIKKQFKDTDLPQEEK